MTNMESGNESLFFTFRGKKVTCYASCVDLVRKTQIVAVDLSQKWYRRWPPQGRKKAKKSTLWRFKVLICLERDLRKDCLVAVMRFQPHNP
jgi:hypothetical protein